MIKLSRTIVWAGETFTADTPVIPMTEPASGGYFTVRIDQDDRSWFVSVCADDVVLTGSNAAVCPVTLTGRHGVSYQHTIVTNGLVERGTCDCGIEVQRQYRPGENKITNRRPYLPADMDALHALAIEEAAEAQTTAEANTYAPRYTQYKGYVLQFITGGVAVWSGTVPGRLGDALRITATADEIKRWIDGRAAQTAHYAKQAQS